MAVVHALGPLRERLAEADSELLARSPDVGDPAAQSAVDDFVDGVLDALRALGEEARIETVALRNTGLAQASAEEETSRSVGGLDAPGRLGRR